MAVQIDAVAGNDPRFKKFGKVDPEEFAETDFDNLGYGAVILQSTKTMYFDEIVGQLRLHNVYHIRLKILTDGFSDPDFFTVKFSGRHEYERVIQNHCKIFRQSHGKVTSTKLKSKCFETFQRDSLESWQKVKMPELHRGDIVDWEYTIMTFDFMMPPLWQTNMKYPCLDACLSAEFPRFMQYRYDIKGSDTLSIRHSQTADFFPLNFNYSSHNYPNSKYYLQGRGTNVTVHYNFQSLIDSFTVSHTLPLELLEGDKSDGNPPHPLYGTSSVRMKASSFTQDIGYQGVHYSAWQIMTHLMYTYADPDNRYLSQTECWFRTYNPGYVIVESNNWKRLHKNLWKGSHFWKPVLKNGDAPAELQYLLNPDSEPDTMAIVNAVYNYVQKQYKWDGLMQNHLPDGLDQIRKTKTGASGEVNMMLVSLLRRYGVDAFPVLAATTDFGDVDTSYANIQQFNHILAGVRLYTLSADSRETFLLLDAALPSDAPMKLPGRDRNSMAVAIDTDEYFFMDISADTSDTYNAKKIYISD